MKQNKIYANDWLEWHPYKQATAVDQYYISLANRIYRILNQSNIAVDPRVKNEDLLRMAGCLTAYFEDVISQIGIWRAFTTECQRLYGKFLPFYDLEEVSYFNDEINEEDIRFLLWHHIQQTRDESVVNPENPTIQLVAEDIYNLLAEEYEIAPENEKLQAFFSPNNRYDTFFDYRKLLEWFHYHCYFNAFNIREMIETIDAEEEEEWDNQKYTAQQCNVFRYSITSNLCFISRNNMLSLTTPEWLSRIYGPEYQQAKCFAEVIQKAHAFYVFNKKDELFIYVTDMRTNEKLRIERSSLGDISTLTPNHSAITCTLAQYNGEWHQYGAMLCHPEEDIPKMKEMIKDEAIQDGETHKLYDTFMKQCKGIPFIFISSHEEHLHFLKQKLKFKLPADFCLPKDYPEKCMLTVTRNKGMLVISQGLACIKDKRNPFYDAEEAEKEAFSLYTIKEMCPIELLYYLHDNGMLPDACLKSLQGTEHGKRLLENNYDFFIRYFLQCCREKDLN